MQSNGSDTDMRYTRRIRRVRLVLRAVAALPLLIVHGPSESAQLNAIHDLFGEPIIQIRGEIEEGDLANIQRFAARFLIEQPPARRKALAFSINTPGGDVLEAMKIGRYFRSVLANVESYGTIIYATGSDEAEIASRRKDPDPDIVVLPVDAPLSDSAIVRNYSAGVLMFYGGVKRAHRDNSDQRLGLKTIPVMGIHRPYFAKELFASLSPVKAQDAYKVLETSVRNYLLEMGAPQSLADRMFESASNEIELIPDEEFRTLYKKEESFFQEWIIAKCGAARPPYGLAPNEYENFVKINAWQIRSRMQDKFASDKPSFYVYPHPDYPQPYAENLYRRIRAYNGKVHQCEETAVVNHQVEWAKSITR